MRKSFSPGWEVWREGERVMFRPSFTALSAVVVAAVGFDANASVIFQASAGNLHATAEFSVSGNNLIVRLANTSSFDVGVPADLLTAVFFEIDGVSGLSRVSGLLTGGSVVHYGPDGGGNVGGEFAYAEGLSGAPLGAFSGISSSGFGLFGPGEVFPGGNLEGPTNPDGMNYGIVPAVDDVTIGNSAVTGGFPLIQHEVTFTLSGLPNGFVLDDKIGKVAFQYGTDLASEPTIPGVLIPSPGAIALLALGGITTVRRRR